jgi:predicted permease
VGGRSRDRSLSAILVANVTFVAFLLVATTLVVATFIVITTADLGFDRKNVMVVSYQRSLQGVSDANRPAAVSTLRKNLLERVKLVPGVTGAAIEMNSGGRLGGGTVTYSLTIPGFGETAREDWPETNMITPEYFDVMNIRLIRGRLFEASDTAGTPQVIVINETAARKFFPGRDPLGQVVSFRQPTTIVGVVRDVHFDGPETAVRPAMYLPADQDPYYNGTKNVEFAGRGAVVLRTNVDPRKLAPSILETIRTATGMEPGEARFIDDAFDRLTSGRRFNAALMATFGFIAVGIGVIGVYGTMGFFVARQRRVIGLRMALGATPLRILRSVLGSALRHVLVAVIIGLALARSISASFQSFVFGVRPTETLVYLAVGAFLVLVTAIAAFVPARRASRIDPIVALRQD